MKEGLHFKVLCLFSSFCMRRNSCCLTFIHTLDTATLPASNADVSKYASPFASVVVLTSLASLFVLFRVVKFSTTSFHFQRLALSFCSSVIVIYLLLVICVN